jgi:hypothetical protein
LPPGEAPISTAAWIDSLTANGSAEPRMAPGWPVDLLCNFYFMILKIATLIAGVVPARRFETIIDYFYF